MKSSVSFRKLPTHDVHVHQEFAKGLRTMAQPSQILNAQNDGQVVVVSGTGSGSTYFSDHSDDGGTFMADRLEKNRNNRAAKSLAQRVEGRAEPHDAPCSCRGGMSTTLRGVPNQTNCILCGGLLPAAQRATSTDPIDMAAAKIAKAIAEATRARSA
jgi:hypothetical protein